LALFSNKQESNLRSCIRMVEDGIAALGHTPDDCRSESQDDLPAWRVPTPPGHVDVFLGVDAESNVLRVVATVGRLRTSGEGLFRRLLELNASEVKGLAFGLRGDEVVLVSERPTLDLDPSEVMDILKRAEGFATRYAQVLEADLSR
jgi:hypothetical protein